MIFSKSGTFSAQVSTVSRRRGTSTFSIRGKFALHVPLCCTLFQCLLSVYDDDHINYVVTVVKPKLQID